MEIVVPASVDAVLAAAAAEGGDVKHGVVNRAYSEAAPAACPKATGRPTRDAAKGVAAAVSAAAASSRKRSAHSEDGGEAATWRSKARRAGAAMTRAPSGIPRDPAFAADTASGRASDSVQSLETRSAETDEEDEQAAEIVAMMAAGRTSGYITEQQQRRARRFGGESRASPASGNLSSPRGSDGSSDAIDASRRRTASPRPSASPLATPRSAGKARSPNPGAPFVPNKGRTGGGTSTGTQVHKRQLGQVAVGAGRTRPTNNQLLYKAHFRWEHYPYKISGAPQLKTETEACASVTSAFLQVLSSLHEAESRREGAPRNILRLLSTNTRRTKVVELTSGTHRVPDELRRHCLTDVSGGQYSTNLDRNRYGADNQYLNTVIRYDLDFLGLCPGLVDVEIIDAKNADGTKLIRAERAQCCCGCEDHDAADPKDVPSHAPGGGIFDMLVLAATADADACMDETPADEDARVDAASSEQSTEMGGPRRIKPEQTGKPSCGKMHRSESVTSLAEMAEEQSSSEAAQKEIAELRAQLAAAQDRATQAEAAAAELSSSDRQAKLITGELEALKLLKAQMSTDMPDLAAMQRRFAALEARVALLTQERDTHAAAHSYYAVWVQQLQAEVTTLLKVAHANGGLCSPQLLNLARAGAAAAPPASEADAEALLRAQYEHQVQQLLQQQMHVASAAQQAMAQQAPAQLAIPAGLPTSLHGFGTASAAGLMEITPLRLTRPAAPASPVKQQAVDNASNVSDDSAATPQPV
eukprot:jgi/Tetstr1/449029/TSEL_003797.t1